MDLISKHSVFKKSLELDENWVYPMFDSKNNPCGTLLKINNQPEEWIQIEDSEY